MPTDPARQAAETLARAAAALRDAHKSALNAAALEAKKTLLAEVAKVSSSGRLRNVGRSGANLGVGYEVNVSPSGGKATMRARGPWHFVERNIGRHLIGPRRRRGRKAALKFPDGGIRRGPIDHPGVKRQRKEPWSKGERAAGPKVEKIMAERYIRAVGRAWH